MKNIFIVGSKGIPGAYGGYETFVDKLTEYHADREDIRYHVACKNMEEPERMYHNARCFCVKVPNLGPAQAIYYDVMALAQCCRYIREHAIEAPVIYILACRIGPFMAHFQRKIHRLGGVVYINPDGHEWMRAKWSKPVRAYWKYSEKHMVKHCDLAICDSVNIEKYIQQTYADYQPKTTYIAYGAEVTAETADSENQLAAWYKERGILPEQYYLIVGRFVPENNYETMIREFMRSATKKKLVIITNVSDKFYGILQEKLHFEKDERIVFAGTVYDQKLLAGIRRNAYGYLHGHEVGGTNPSLLEALGSTKLNLLLEVGFNKEVGQDAACYWTKEDGNLAQLLETADAMPAEQIEKLGQRAKQRICDAYSWEFIAREYEKVWETEGL